MSVLEDLFNRIKNSGEEDDDDMYDDDYDDDDEYEAEPPVKKNVFQKKPREVDDYAVDEPAPKKPVSKVTPIKPSLGRRNANIGAGMEVCVIRPTTVDEAREVTETLLAERTVVLNLEGVDVDIAQRIIDFTSGSCFAIHGNLQKIANFIFIITPESVEISGDIQDIFGGAFGTPLNN